MIDFEKLNNMQRKAVSQIDGPLLILAGAGSGKTKALTVRIAYIIEKGISPFNILAITFTNKAAKEMKERVNSIVGEISDKIWIATFHSTCVKILKKHINKIGYKNNFSIYDSNDQQKIIKDIFKQLNYTSDKNFSYKYALNQISKCKDNLISPEEYQQNSDNDFEKLRIANIYKTYQKFLKENNALDFDDIIYKTIILLKSDNNVLNYYQEKFKYIMVDEYQDTSFSQYELIKLLSHKYKNICVVGDDDQSIYGWRGADIRNILDFEKDFSNATIIKLEQNYRSTKTILNVANSVIFNNKKRKEKVLWTENKSGSIIHLNSVDTDLDEAYFVCNNIKNIAKIKNKRYNNFAILYRTNAQSRVIEEQLVKNNIPYKIFSGIGFYDRKEIKDIIAYLRLLQNPHDSISFERIINVPKRGIGDISLEKLKNFSNENNISILDSILYVDDIVGLKQKAKNFKNFYDIFYQIIEKINNADTYISIEMIINYILDKTEYIKMLKQELNCDEISQKIDNIYQFISKAVEYENNIKNPSLEGFLEQISLVTNIDNHQNDQDYVTLMTVHTSKGLEFNYVFIIGMEENVFPSYNSIKYGNNNDIEEERRLCYVAITRAKKELFMTYSKRRLQNGIWLNNPPSRFLKEIPEKFVDNPLYTKIIANRNIINNNKLNFNHFSKKSNINSIPTPKNVNLDFDIGDSVRVPKLGIGVIQNIKPGGADFEVEVLFPEKGTKKFMASLFNLKKVSE